jgi:hypothetical protein
MKVIVPKDHGATDVLREEEASIVVRPHRFPGDTYPSLWFYFQVVNNTGRDLPHAQIVVEELKQGHDSYEPFWKHCLWSRDGVRWERIPDSAQRFGETTLTIETSLKVNESRWIAETFPLSYAHYLRLCDDVSAPRWKLGDSAQGRPIFAFHVQSGQGATKRNVLLIAGQHAVEQSGKIFAETILRGYHSGAFAGTVMEELLKTHNVFVVPLANPDGCYDGRMNTNAEGVVMDDPSDNAIETLAILDLIDELHPRVLINCHGWGNEQGTPPYEDIYRWTDEDALFAYLRTRVPGCSTSKFPHWLADRFRLECHARERYGTECIITELNWNCYVPPDGSPPRLPTLEDIQARAVEYFTAIAQFCLESS